MKKITDQVKRSWFKLVAASTVAVVFFSFTVDEDLFQISKNLEIFTSVYNEINLNYVDEVSSSKLIKTGVDAMLENLDPYTEFVPEPEIEDYRMKYVSTQYGGIGATIFQKNGKVYISEPYEGFPAQKADIRAGDEILQINGISVENKSNEQVSQLLKGPKGTPIKLILKRQGESASIEKSLMREEILQKNVSYQGMLPGNVGYIKLDKFLENSAQEVREALLDIKKKNPAGLVLDLRHNGGGILQEAVKIMNLFIEKDITAVVQKGRNREKTIAYKTFQSPVDPNIPIVVLVNNRSASASEIVAGGLQDLDRAVVIGQRSFGKGLVQQTFNLPYNSLVKVTVAKYYTPSGRCIQSLDYTHREGDGNVLKVADSLISEYKTKAGRSVYDGSGIFPDIFVAPVKYNHITQTLASKNYIFDFATNYRNTNATIPDAKSFKLSDAEYGEFVNYLSGKDYNYYTTSERLVNDLKAIIEKDNKMAEVKNEFDALKNKVSFSKKNDLSQFKDEIKRVLESEIVSRYYYQTGRLEYSFRNDGDLAEAAKVLANKQMLASILKGDGEFKVIGKPGNGFSANAGK